MPSTQTILIYCLRFVLQAIINSEHGYKHLLMDRLLDKLSMFISCRQKIVNLSVKYIIFIAFGTIV